MMSDTSSTQYHEAYQGDEITEHVRLPEAGLRELVARNAHGVIRVRGTERDDVLVHAVKGGNTGSRRYREASLYIEEHDGRIFVRPHIPGGPGWIGLGLPTGLIRRGPGRFDFDVDFDKLNFAFGGDVWFDIEIELPRQAMSPASAISVRNASGEVDVAGVQGQVSIATSSGEVAVKQTQGNVNVTTASGDVVLSDVGAVTVAKTASGDVHVSNARGRLTALSASGDVDVHDGALADLHISTASGDHNVTSAFTSPGPYRFETVSGDVNLALVLPLTGAATEPAARLEYSTVSGDAALPPSFRHAGKKTWESGESGPAQAAIRVKTVSGDLHIRMSGDASLGAEPAPTGPIERGGDMPTEPVPPMPPVPPTPPNPSFSEAFDAFAAASEQIARQAESVSVRAMQQAADALERAAAKMRPLGTIPDSQAVPGQRTSTRPGSTEPRGPEVGAEPAAPPPTFSPEAEQKRLDVLQALERGEIDIDDAMSRLEAIESGATAATTAPEETAPAAPETETGTEAESESKPASETGTETPPTP